MKNKENSKNITICEYTNLEVYLKIYKDVCIAQHSNDADILDSVWKNHKVDKVRDEENEED